MVNQSIFPTQGQLTSIIKYTIHQPARRMCWSLGISSQSKQHISSPVKNRIPLLPKCSSITFKLVKRLFLETSSRLVNINLNFYIKNIQNQLIKTEKYRKFGRIIWSIR